MLNCKITGDEVKEYIANLVSSYDYNGMRIDDYVEVLNDENYIDYDLDYGENSGFPSGVHSFVVCMCKDLYNLYFGKEQEIDLMEIFKLECISEMEMEDLEGTENKHSYIDKFIERYKTGLSAYSSSLEFSCYLNNPDYEDEDEYINSNFNFLIDIIGHYNNVLTSKIQEEDKVFNCDVMVYADRLMKLAENLNKNLKTRLKYYESKVGQEECERCLALGIKDPLDEVKKAIRLTEGQVFDNIMLDDDLKIVDINGAARVYEEYCDKDVLENIKQVEAQTEIER